MKPVRFFIPILFLFFCSSCSRYYYKPNAVNTPLFTEAGQAHFNLAGSFGGVSDEYDGNTSFADVQAAVSPVNHLGIIANYSTYSYRPDVPDASNGNVTGRAHILEAGVGGYYAKGKKFKMVVDGYAGYGGGNIKSDVDMKVKRFFIQPGIGVHSPWFDAAFNIRISNVRYTDFNQKGMSDDYLRNQNLITSEGRRIDNGSYTFAEPSITLRGGYKFAKIQLQMVLAQDLNAVVWHYNAARFSAGFYFSLEDALEKNRKK